MKYAQRLDDARLAEVLNERGMADLDAIREMLQTARNGGTAFCDAVVSANLVSDWDLSRVAAELFQLPFLPVEICNPDPKLWEELESPTLCENGLVPLQRFGQVLTVAMPGLVPAEVLGLLAAETDLFLMPVVGTVESNRRWIEDHRTKDAGGGRGGDWGSLFDNADAAVQADLNEDAPEETAGEADAELIVADEELDIDAIEFTTEAEDEELVAPPSLAELGAGELEAELDVDTGDDNGPVDLPPVPEFGG